jgi:tRNA/tmRNA/rRNA uracil-C5-methylase (TrmA/RlmC/RlmD family)
MTRRVTIVNLAPTGEGVAKTPDGIGFVAGALPGEEAEVEVLEVRPKFWKGRAVSISSRSPLRRSGRHAGGCAGCDWAYFEIEAARQAKRGLFLETMERIGELSPALFGSLPIEASPLSYRLRNRFHASGRGEETRLGYFAPRTHRVESAGECEALSESLQALLPRLRDAIASSGAAVEEIATVEDLPATRRHARVTLQETGDRREANAVLEALAGLFDGAMVAAPDGPILARTGERRLWIPVGGREFPLTPSTFFQTNRYLLDSLYGDVKRWAARIPPGRALDLFGGVGLFAGALLDAGHSVVTVEAGHASVEQALAARRRWGGGAWEVVHAEALGFVERERESFDVVVADPPRSGLGLPLARALARRRPRLLLYVSCETATLARDLAQLTGSGLPIASATLYDLYPLTHRVEAVVALSASGAD